MKQICIYNNESIFNIKLKQIKFMLGYNYELKYHFLQIIRQVFSRANSEKREEYGLKGNITINNEEINSRNSVLWEISDAYSLSEDLKLGTKSLVTAYFEVKMQNKMYFDSMNTIEILFNSFEMEINEDDELNMIFNAVNSKTLIKFMKANLIKEELQHDEYDLSYEQIILLQIKMISYILSNKIYNSTSFVIVHVPTLTKSIIEAVWNIPNALVFVFTEEYISNINVKDITLFESEFVDCRDIDLIYRIVDQRYCKLLTLNKMEEQMKEYLIKHYCKEHTKLTAYLAKSNS